MNEQPKFPTKVVPGIQRNRLDVDTEEIVDISCQASLDCPGRQATRVEVVDIETTLGYAGRNARYRCCLCGQEFVL